jgi:putative redox protein
MSITLRMYAERKGWTLRKVEVQLNHKKMPMKDCEECESENVMFEEIESQILLEGDLNEIERHRLFEIAVRCPVHRTLSGSLRIRSTLI